LTNIPLLASQSRAVREVDLFLTRELASVVVELGVLVEEMGAAIDVGPKINDVALLSLGKQLHPPAICT